MKNNLSSLDDPTVAVMSHVFFICILDGFALKETLLSKTKFNRLS